MYSSIMTGEQFSRLVSALATRSMRVLGVKSSQYRPSENDQLYCFRLQANYQRRPPSDVCLTLMLKHVTALVKATANPYEPLTFGDARCEGILQKVIDLINYVYLWVANRIAEVADMTEKPVEEILQQVINEALEAEELEYVNGLDDVGERMFAETCAGPANSNDNDDDNNDEER